MGVSANCGSNRRNNVPILKPQDSASDYFNRKGYYSILTQEVVDYKGFFFIDVNIGWPGKVRSICDL